MRRDPPVTRGMAGHRRWIAVAALAAAVGVPLQADAANVFRSGTVRVSATATLVTTIPASNTITASVELATFDAVTTNSQSILVDTNVTRTGNKATVTVAIPYRFILNSARAGSATLTATVTLYVNNTQAYASSGPITIPATSVTTPVTVQLAL